MWLIVVIITAAILASALNPIVGLPLLVALITLLIAIALLRRVFRLIKALVR